MHNFENILDISSYRIILKIIHPASRKGKNFENQTEEEMNDQVNANVETTFKVKFDHVAMDNFHAVFIRTT